MRPVTPTLRALIRWPFASRAAAPLWLLLRLHLGAIWLEFALSKLRGGWLTTNPMQAILSAIAEGHLPGPFPLYRGVAETLLSLGADRWLSVGIPVAEMAVALALFSGFLVVPAAIGATLLNLNLILSGIASWHFDGRIILLQLLLVAAWRVSGFLDARWMLRTLRVLFHAALHGPGGRPA